MIDYSVKPHHLSIVNSNPSNSALEKVKSETYPVQLLKTSLN
jgi:hypothetical protein